MQQPSSLIFLAIVVIWAAYLLQHWIRRREALATARSVDQFSDAMRVLERREHRTEGVAEQASDSPHASRPSAPQVHESGPRPSLRAGTVMTGETQQPVTRSTAEQHGEASASAAERFAAAGNSSADAVQRFGRFAAHAGSPRLRAVALIGSLSLLLITIVCAPFGALPWWSPILMLAVSGGVFWWCRASAMAARPATKPSSTPRSRPKNAGQRRSNAVKLPQRVAAPTPSTSTSATASAAPAPLTKATMPDPVVEHAPAPAAEQVFDVSATVAAPEPEMTAPVVDETPVAQAAPAAQEAEDSWEPVAVPRPTYTMKERAPERPQHAPAPTSERRSYDDVANEDLPFDGLALDQDLDDLPSVFRAG